MTHEDFPPAFLCGVTGYGKTYRAVAEACIAAAALNWPILAIDSQGNRPGTSIADIPLYPDVRSVLSAVYGPERRNARFIPGKNGVEEVEKIFAAVRACGRVVLLTDEVGYWASARGTPPEMELVCRAWRHIGVVLLFTSQHPADVSPQVVQCIGRVFAFRCDSVAALDRLRLQWGLDPEKVRTLEKRSCILWGRE